jgi:ABC-2 type transport system permease protein
MIVTGDRWEGLLEPVLATPSEPAPLILGRIASVMVLGLFGFVEVWTIGRVGFGVSMPFEHPLALVLTLLATVFAMAGTAVLFAALFVLTRNAYTFANSASFPFYVLGGVFVPVAILPGWMEPATKVVFMSWSADLLRASLKADTIDNFWGRLGMVALLGVLSFAVGRGVLARVLYRMRTNGELSTA